MSDGADLDDYKLPDAAITNKGWRRVWFDRNLGQAELSTVPKDIEVFIHYDNSDYQIALIIRADTKEIVGIHLEGVDFKAYRP